MLKRRHSLLTCIESLEGRLLLAMDLPGMHLVDSNVDRFDGQVIYLDTDGERGVMYHGPVSVGPFPVRAFSAPEPFAGQEPDILAHVLDRLNVQFAGVGVRFTVDKPATGRFSTIYVGGTDTWFEQHGSFLGLVERVDVGNVDDADVGLIFSELLLRSSHTVGVYANTLADIIAHEAGHLLGYAHDGDTNDNTLRSLAYDLDTHWELTYNAALLYQNMYGVSGLSLAFMNHLSQATGLSIRTGVVEEDSGTRWLNHFCMGGDGDELFDGLNLGGWINTPYETANEDRYPKAINSGTAADRYYWLGRTMHLLQDSTVPAHVHKDEHPVYDTYEKNAYTYRSYFSVTDTTGYWNFQPGDPGANAWSRYPYLRARSYDTLEQLFRETTDYADDYDSDDEKGDYHNSTPGDTFPTSRLSSIGRLYHSTWARDNVNGGDGTRMSDAEVQYLAWDLGTWAVEQSAILMRHFFRDKGWVVSKPTALRSIGATQKSISIDWDDVSGATGYAIYRWNGSNYSYLTKTSASSYVDTGLSAGSTYFYRAYAYNTSAGLGQDYAELTASTGTGGPPGSAPAITITSPTSAPTWSVGTNRVYLHGSTTGTISQVSWINQATGDTGVATIDADGSWDTTRILLNAGANVIVVTATGPNGSSSDTITVTYNTDISTVTLHATAGASILSGSPANNYGDGVMYLGYDALSSVRNERVLVRFDLNGAIPQGSTITDASLSLVNTTTTPAGAASFVATVYRLTSDWGEMSVTWNTRPSHSTAGSATATVGSATNQRYSWGITDIVRVWAGTPSSNYGVMLISNVENSGTTNDRAFKGNGGTNAPLLKISYVPPANDPPTLRIAQPTTWSEFWTTASQVSLRGTASDDSSVTRVSWTNAASGASGTAVGTSSWSADIGLIEGANAITVTAWDAQDSQGSDSLTVYYTAPDVTPPSVPQSVAAASVSSEAVRVTWAVSSDAGGLGVAQYEVYRNEGAAPVGIIDHPEATFLDVGLDPGTLYTYTVRARDKAGNASGQSVPASASTAPPVSRPEISVVGNGLNIATGDSTPSLADGTNFGTVVLGAAGVIRTFTIQNTGNANLVLGPVQLPSGFTLVASPGNPVLPGTTATFQVRLDTVYAGLKMGWLSFANSDSDENPFSFYITGTVTPTNPPAQDLTPPTARLATISRISAGKRAAFVVVEYADAGGINLQSIDNSDIRVLRTGRPAVSLQRSSVLSLNGGTLVRAKYALPPIGGTWDSSDNGTYTIWLRGRQVADTAGNAALKTRLGVFKISLGAAKASRAAAAEPALFPARIADAVRSVSDRFSARPIVADILSPSALDVDDEPRALL